MAHKNKRNEYTPKAIALDENTLALLLDCARRARDCSDMFTGYFAHFKKVLVTRVMRDGLPPMELYRLDLTKNFNAGEIRRLESYAERIQERCALLAERIGRIEFLLSPLVLPQTSLPEAKHTLFEAETSLAEAETSLAEAKSSPAEAKTSPAEAETSLAEAKTSLAEAKTSLAEAKTSQTKRKIARLKLEGLLAEYDFLREKVQFLESENESLWLENDFLRMQIDNLWENMQYLASLAYSRMEKDRIRREKLDKLFEKWTEKPWQTAASLAEMEARNKAAKKALREAKALEAKEKKAEAKKETYVKRQFENWKQAQTGGKESGKPWNMHKLHKKPDYGAE